MRATGPSIQREIVVVVVGEKGERRRGEKEESEFKSGTNRERERELGLCGRAKG